MSETQLTSQEYRNFQSSIDSITARRLTPENIDDYADIALDDLIEIVGDITNDFVWQPVVYGSTNKETEQAAFSYFGLDVNTVEATLDHVAAISEQIHDLDGAIAEATARSGRVILPPNPGQLPEITPGDGSFKEKQVIPRLKTLSFILESRFEIDLRNQEGFNVTTGVLDDGMMRGQSYNLVEVPSLNRAIFVCDEEGNATFVFDTERLARVGIDSETLSSMTKDELRDYLEQHSGAGRRLIHSNRFVEQIIALLEEIPESEDKVDVDVTSSQFLKSSEKAPEGYLVANRIAKEYSLSQRTVFLAIADLEDILTPLTVMVRSNRAKFYSPDDQKRIYDYLMEKGSLAPLATEEQLSAFGMAKKFNVPRSAIERAIYELGDDMGEVKKAKFSTTVSSAYSHVQQELVQQWLDENEKFGMSEVQLANELQTTRHLIRKIRRALGGEQVIGSLTGEGRHVLIPATQHELIKQKVAEYKEKVPKGISNAPDGYESKMDMVRRLGVHSKTMSRAIEATQEQLGEVINALFSNNTSPAYSPEQQKIIETWLSENMKRQKNSKLGRALLKQAVSGS